MTYENGRLTRLRMYVLVLTVVIVFAAIATPIVVVTTFQREAASTQLDVTCTILRSNIRELTAIESVRRELGLPGSIVIPSVPSQCRGVGE